MASLQTSADGSYTSPNLADGEYTVSASKTDYGEITKEITISGSSKTVDFELDKALSGTVVNQNGQPVPNATVQILAANYSALESVGGGSPAEIRSRAKELLNQASNVTPPEWTKPSNLDLVSQFGDRSGTYVAVHSKSDWSLEGYRIQQLNSPAVGANARLSQPTMQLDKGQTAVFSIWDATKGGVLEDNVDEDLPGKTTSGTVVFQQVGPGGENLATQRQETSGTVKIRSVSNPGSKTHETAATELSPGFYRVYPESNPTASYIITVGNPQDMIQGWRTDLKTEANNLADSAKKIRNQINSTKFKPITTTTDANGRFSVGVEDSGLQTAKVVAYRAPDGLDKPPEDLSMEDMREYYNKADEEWSDARDSVEDGSVEDYQPDVGTDVDWNRNWQSNWTSWRDSAEETVDQTEDSVDDARDELNESRERAKEATEAVQDLGGSFMIPASSPTTDIPASNVTVRVRESSHPPFADPGTFGNITDQYWSLMQNSDYAEASGLIQQGLSQISDPEKRKMLKNLQRLAQENGDFRNRYQDNLDDVSGGDWRDGGGYWGGGGGGGGQTVVEVNNTPSEEMRQRVEALQQTIAELRDTIEAGDVVSDIGAGTTSLTFPFDSTLNPEQVAVLVHYSNGTTSTLSPTNSSYVSIEENLIGGDSVKVTDFPLGEGDAAVANFEVLAANEDGLGRSQKRVTNPTFDGEIPSLAGIDVSTLRPGASETVDLEVHPDEDASFKKVENVTVYGPRGETIPANVTGARTAEFTTDGRGVYHIKTVYSNLDGQQFATTTQLTAGQSDQELPAGLRIVESTVGTYALTGDGLDSGRVKLSESGSKLTVFAAVENESDIPNQMHVYTHAVSLPPDSTLELNVVHGEDQREITQTVGVTLHMAELPTDSYVYRNDGEPLPMGDSTQFGRVMERAGHSVVTTYTANDGTLTVQTNSNPGWVDKAFWFWRTQVPNLPFMLDISGLVPSLPSSPTPAAPAALLGVAGVQSYRRRAN